MMDIEKLLRKRKWKGAEVGALRVANSLVAYGNAVESGNPNAEGLVSTEKIRQMMHTITDPEEAKIYNGYMSISDWIDTALQMAIAQEQQAQFQFGIMREALSNAIVAEDIYTYIEGLPVIMTEKQYQDMVEARTHEILHPDWIEHEGAEMTSNVMMLVVDALEHYLRLLEEEPGAVNPLQPLIKSLDKTPVKDLAILENYNKINGLGYYRVENEERELRSDFVSPSYWRRIAMPLLDNCFDKLGLEEIEASAIRKNIVYKKHPVEHCLLFAHNEKLTEQEREKLLKKESKAMKEISKFIKWHYYEDYPDNISKWEILSSGSLMEYYPYYEEELTDKARQKIVESFYNEFEEVITALIDDMVKRYPKLKELVEVPLKEWLNYSIGWEMLYDLDFYGFRNTYTGDAQIFDGDRRALANGIAIVRPSDLGMSTRIDAETGYYKSPDISRSVKQLSLEGFFAEAEDYEDNVFRIDDARETFIASLYFIRAFNEALDLINSLFKIEEVNIIKRNVPHFERIVERYNSTVDSLYNKIANTNYEDKEMKEKKLAVLRTILRPIDLSDSQIPKGRLAKTKADMRDFKAFTGNAQNPIRSLCMYIPGYEQDVAPTRKRRGK